MSQILREIDAVELRIERSHGAARDELRRQHNALEQQLNEVTRSALQPQRDAVAAARGEVAKLRGSWDYCKRKAAEGELEKAEAALDDAVGAAFGGEWVPRYFGPYPLFNATLNIVGGEDLAYQDRKGASFVLSPGHCGSRETGYARLPTDDAKYNLTLGRAMTISGAAIDPNMKDYQSAQLTAFLTILNARLGWWILNPDYTNPDRQRGWWGSMVEWVWRRFGAAITRWNAEPPMQGAYRYLRELFGYTVANDDYVHLSDGGHFDCTGVYELIRRRCRYVVAVDAAEDTSDASENLANLIRLVRADFGVEIEIDTSLLKKNDKGVSPAHCAIGVIRYDYADEGGVTGTFVFIRSSMTGDESADLRNYAETNPPFPHHSTLDQFFDDAQFESYRKLGEHIGLSAFSGPAEDAAQYAGRARQDSRGDGCVANFNRWLFSELRRYWAPLPPGGAQRYADSCRDFLSHAAPESDGEQRALVNRSLYPELRHLYEAAEGAADREGERKALGTLRAMSWLFQTMELAWLDNDLSRFSAHPLNRGWMNTLRRWTASDQFHNFWAVLRPMYSHGFVRFCERTLNMPDLPVRWCRVHDPDGEPWKLILKEFDGEFGKEWSGVSEEEEFKERQESFVSQAVEDSRKAGLELESPQLPFAWVLTTGRRSEARGVMVPAEWKAYHIPLGVVVAYPSRQAGEWEFLLWVRPWYRSTGLGRLAMALLLPEIEALIPRDVKSLVARYPVVGSTGGDHLVRTLWTLFFNDLGFVRWRGTGAPAPRKELRLVRRLADRP